MPTHAALRLLLLLLLAPGVFSGCSRSAQGAGDAPPPALSVKTQAARRVRVGDSTEYIATLRSQRSTMLRPDVEGQITHIFAKSGDRVAAGAALIEIDPSKQQATLNSQEATRRSRLAELEYNRAEWERRKQLFAAGVISKQELDQAQAAYDASRAAVEALEATVHEQQVQLRYHTVRAPVAGTVGDIPVRVGDRVKVDTLLTTVDETAELEAYISIPAEKSGEVHVGTAVEIDENDKPAARSTVSFISPRVDPENQLLLIKAIIPNQRQQFRNEQVVHSRVIWKETERVVIPVTAVSRRTGQSFAFIAEMDGKNTVARQRALRLGDIVDNDYVVLDGIKPGEKVIITGVQMLADGMPVTPES